MIILAISHKQGFWCYTVADHVDEANSQGISKCLCGLKIIMVPFLYKYAYNYIIFHPNRLKFNRHIDLHIQFKHKALCSIFCEYI